jgi:hypothetical protein
MRTRSRADPLQPRAFSRNEVSLRFSARRSTYQILDADPIV